MEYWSAVRRVDRGVWRCGNFAVVYNFWDIIGCFRRANQVCSWTPPGNSTMSLLPHCCFAVKQSSAQMQVPLARLCSLADCNQFV
jgi:hypothetical protein